MRQNRVYLLIFSIVRRSAASNSPFPLQQQASLGESNLGGRRHRVGLVEDDEAEREAGLSVGEDGGGGAAREPLHLLAHDGDAPLIRGVQLQNPGLVVLPAANGASGCER